MSDAAESSVQRSPCPECSYPCEAEVDGGHCRCPECGAIFVPEAPSPSPDVRLVTLRIGGTLALWSVMAMLTLFSLRSGDLTAWLGVTLFGMVALTAAILGPAYSISACQRVWPRDDSGRFESPASVRWAVLALVTPLAVFVPILGTLALVYFVIDAYRGLGL